MITIEQLKADKLEARRNRDDFTLTLLTTLIGEYETQAKKSDVHVLDIIKKFIKDIDKSLNIKHNDVLVSEKLELSKYLPKQLTESELREIITGFIQSDSSSANIGSIMTHLKTKFINMYDSKLAMVVIRSCL